MEENKLLQNLIGKDDNGKNEQFLNKIIKAIKTKYIDESFKCNYDLIKAIGLNIPEDRKPSI